MPLPPVIELTGDGSHTLRNPELNVTYHSSKGAIGESKHVFLHHGLEFLAATKKEIAILEVGFGTGLNAFLTYLYSLANPSLKIGYTGIEKFPLSEEIAAQLNYPEALDAVMHSGVFRRMHFDPHFVQANYSFARLTEDITKLSLSQSFDLVYFDPFDPQTQPEMWHPETLRGIRDHLHPGSVLVTYSSQGQFRRDLKALGFEVEKLPGPLGKREMVRAVLDSPLPLSTKR